MVHSSIAMTLGDSGSPAGASAGGVTVSPSGASSVPMRQAQTSPRALPQRRFTSSPLAGPSTSRFADTPRTTAASPLMYTPSDGRFASFSHTSPPHPYTAPSSPASTRLRAGRTPPSVPIRSPVSQSGSPLNRRRMSEQSLSGGSLSQTPHVGSLVGSYEESLLTGRMSTLPSKPLVFDAELGVLGLGKCKASLKCPPHLNFKFPAYFYSLDGGAAAAEKEGKASPSTPYVGTIDVEGHYLEQLLQQSDADATSIQDRDDTPAVPIAEPLTPPHNAYRSHPMRASSSMASNTRNMSKKSSSAVPSFPGYRVPAKGQIQLVIKNPNLTAVKVFLVPYDLSDMPAGTKTFIRQKCHVAPPASAAVDAEQKQTAPPASPRSSTKPVARETLRYAVHLQFCAVPATASQRRASEPGFSGDGRLRMSANDERAHERQKDNGKAGEPRLYLHKAIRVVFSARVPDKSERLSSVTETPRGAQGEGMYSTYSGPGDEWKDARRAAKAEEAAAAAAHAIRARAEAERAHLDTDFDHSMANSDPNGERWDQRTPDGVQRFLSASINEAQPYFADGLATDGIATVDVGEARDGIAALQMDAVDIPSHSRTSSWNRSRATSEITPSRFATGHAQSIAASMQDATRSRAPSLETANGVNNAAPLLGRYAAAPLALNDATTDDRVLLEQWHASLGGARTQPIARPPSPTASRSRPTSPLPLRSPITGSALAMTRTLSNTSSSASDHQPIATSSSRSSLRGAVGLRVLTPQRTGSPSPFASLYATPMSGSSGSVNAGLQSLPSPKLSAASIDAEHVKGVIMPFALGGNSAEELREQQQDGGSIVSSDSGGLRPSLLRRLSSHTNGGSQNGTSSGRGSPAVLQNTTAANIFTWRQATRSRAGSEESGDGRPDV